MTPHPQRCEHYPVCYYVRDRKENNISDCFLCIADDPYLRMVCGMDTRSNPVHQQSEQEIRNELLEDISGFIAGWGSLNYQIPKKALKKKIAELRKGGCPDKLSEEVCDTNVCGDVCPHYLTSEQEIRERTLLEVIGEMEKYRHNSTNVYLDVIYEPLLQIVQELSSKQGEQP